MCIRDRAEALLHKVEVASQSIGLFLNVTKTKVMHINPSSEDNATSGDVIDQNRDKIEDIPFSSRVDPSLWLCYDKNN